MNRLLWIVFAVMVLLSLYPIATGIGQTMPNAGAYLPLISVPGTSQTATPTLIPTNTPTGTPTPTNTPLPPTVTVTSTATATPTVTPTKTNAPATTTPTPTRTVIPSTATPTATSTSPASFICSSDTYNCSDFTTQAAAQQVFDYCFNLGFGDVHRLDSNNDKVACESLP